MYSPFPISFAFLFTSGMLLAFLRCSFERRCLKHKQGNGSPKTYSFGCSSSPGLCFAGRGIWKKNWVSFLHCNAKGFSKAVKQIPEIKQYCVSPDSLEEILRPKCKVFTWFLCMHSLGGTPFVSTALPEVFLRIQLLKNTKYLKDYPKCN